MFLLVGRWTQENLSSSAMFFSPTFPLQFCNFSLWISLRKKPKSAELIQVKIRLKKGFYLLLLWPVDGCVSMAVWELVRSVMRQEGLFKPELLQIYYLFCLLKMLNSKIDTRCCQNSNKTMHLIPKYLFSSRGKAVWENKKK